MPSVIPMPAPDQRPDNDLSDAALQQRISAPPSASVPPHVTALRDSLPVSRIARILACPDGADLRDVSPARWERARNASAIAWRLMDDQDIAQAKRRAEGPVAVQLHAVLEEDQHEQRGLDRHTVSWRAVHLLDLAIDTFLKALAGDLPTTEPPARRVTRIWERGR